jgi:hypothetical protein
MIDMLVYSRVISAFFIERKTFLLYEYIILTDSYIKVYNPYQGCTF